MPNTSKLNPIAIEEFNDIHEAVYGYRLSDDEAQIAAEELLGLVLLINST